MKIKSLLKDKTGVFGLTAIQQFFVIILGVALLAYVIVIIMGTLNTASILTTPSGSVTNETLMVTGATALSVNGHPNCVATITKVVNQTTTQSISSGNYTVAGCVLTNTTDQFTNKGWNVTYTYTYDSNAQVNTKNILTNTSTGVSNFFGSINPVYAILAILVIILVLVVLVRVVQAPSGRETSPQL